MSKKIPKTPSVKTESPQILSFRKLASGKKVSDKYISTLYLPQLSVDSFMPFHSKSIYLTCIILGLVGKPKKVLYTADNVKLRISYNSQIPTLGFKLRKCTFFL